MSSIHETLSKIREELPNYVQKDKQVTGTGGYSYLSEAKVKLLLKVLLPQHKINFSASITHSDPPFEISPTRNGTKQFLTAVKGTYEFTSFDVEGSCVRGTWAGQGVDTGDKGIYKALTGGIRHILMTIFLIPTGTDPEQNENESDDKAGKPPQHPPASKPEKNPLTTEHAKLGKKILVSCDGEIEKAKKWLLDHTGKSSMNDLNTAELKKVAVSLSLEEKSQRF